MARLKKPDYLKEIERKRKAKTPKKKYRCKGGPFDGEYLALTNTSHVASSAIFFAKGQQGRYIQKDTTVYCWEPYLGS